MIADIEDVLNLEKAVENFDKGIFKKDDMDAIIASLHDKSRIKDYTMIIRGALILLNGLGRAPDPDGAWDLFMIAGYSDHDDFIKKHPREHSLANYYLATMLDDGGYFKSDPGKARYRYHKALKYLGEGAHPLTRYKLGLFELREGIPPFYSANMVSKSHICFGHLFDDLSIEEDIRIDDTYQLGLFHFNNKEYQKALTSFEKTAELGHLESKDMVAKSSYMLGHEAFKNDRELSIQYLEKAATIGSKDALFSLGVMIERGIYVDPNGKTTDDYMNEAAKQGSTKAQYRLAMDIERSIKEKAKFKNDRRFDEMILESYDPIKMVIKEREPPLYNGLLEGYDVKIEINSSDLSRYYDLLKQASDQYYTPAMVRLSEIHMRTSRRTPEEAKYDKNLSLTLLSIAKDQGNSDAMVTLSDWFFFNASTNGKKEIIDLLEAARKNGNLEAMRKLGEYYEVGYTFCEKDLNLALKYLSEYVEKSGYRECNLLYKIAETYFLTTEDTDKYTKYMDLLNDAAREGSNAAQSKLRLIYVSNELPFSDISTLKSSSEKGYQEASAILGLKYYQGEGVPVDRAEGLRLLEKVDPDARRVLESFIIGKEYFHGSIVEKDYDKAFESLSINDIHYTNDLEDKYHERSYLLGRCHEEGLGTEVNKNEATYLYSQSDGYGDADSRKEDMFRKEAKECRKAYEKGSLEAQYTLGLMYFHGAGVKKNEVKAKKLLENYEQDGIDMSFGLSLPQDSCYSVVSEACGLILFNEKRYEQAVPHLEKAFWGVMGYGPQTPAIRNALGSCYEFGLGTEIDLEKAVDVYSGEDKEALLKKIEENEASQEGAGEAVASDIPSM